MRTCSNSQNLAQTEPISPRLKRTCLKTGKSENIKTLRGSLCCETLRFLFFWLAVLDVALYELAIL